MAATKLPKGYYDPKDHVLVHREYIDGLIDALNAIHDSSGDPVIERICKRALKQQLSADAVAGSVEQGTPDPSRIGTDPQGERR
jgi:hypothetical protein